jgi:hypothetical protein
MNLRNINFINNPIGFLNNNTINHRWFDEHAQAQGQAPLAEREAVRVMDLAKFASFDLKPTATPAQVKFGVVSNQPVMDAPLQGYWCPYRNGNGLPGFVDVPRRNPDHKFVFTAAMNGCAFIITSSPLGGGYFRVYHHQHPGSAGINALIMAATPNVITVFPFEEYGNPHAAGLPVAFNFLYYRNGGWVIVSQSTLMVPLTGVITRDAVMPILITGANV